MFQKIYYIGQYGKNSTIGPDLPLSVYSHAIVNINESVSMLIGGYICSGSKGNSAKTYYFHHETQTWIQGPNLSNARSRPAAGVVTDQTTREKHIIVSGGIGAPSLSEILFYGANQWETGIWIVFMS